MTPVIVLSDALGVDEAFRRYALEVAGDPSRADAIAIRYARHGVGRQVVAAMLRKAAAAPPQFLTTRLMSMSRSRGCFIYAPLEPGDPRNALRTGRLEDLRRGAEIVCRRGAGLCLRCGVAHNRDDHYCRACAPRTIAGVRSDQYAAREILRAVAEELGFESRKGPKVRRALRRRA